MSKAGVSFERVDYIICGEEEAYGEERKEKSEDFDLCFSHVNFAYEEEQPVLSDIDFVLPKGKTLGILGGTGSGKSTLIQLLNRLYELKEGEGSITLGGKNIQEIPLEWLRKNVGVVLQEPFLYSRTIRENIAAARPDATMELSLIHI